MASRSVSRPELSLIAPTYNEQENIGRLVERVHGALAGYDYELIVVDDNSPDGTAETARQLSDQYPVKVVVRTSERGLASAVVAGFGHASGDVLGVIDADLQHPPEALPSLLEAIRGGADVAIGSRYVEGGGIEGWTFKREVISRGAKLLAAILLPSARRIKDPLAGFFLFRRDVIEGAELSPVGYKILLEVLARGTARNVAEVPYTFREREKGQSNLTYKEQVNYLRHLWRLAWFEGDVKRFLKFAAVGISGAGVNLGLLAVLHEAGGLQENIAVGISYEISILTNFVLNDVWTFRDRRVPGRRSVLIRAVKFNLVSLVGWAINLAVFSLAFNIGGIHYIVAEVIAIGVATLWNFFVNVKWTWGVKQEEAPGGVTLREEERDGR
jgi:dolichol-phosphate mannosyltransferase